MGWGLPKRYRALTTVSFIYKVPLEEGFDWDTISLADLPEEMQSMTLDGSVEFIEAKRAQREAIQLEIQTASAEREVFVKQAIAERIGEAGLGEAMRKSIRERMCATRTGAMPPIPGRAGKSSRTGDAGPPAWTPWSGSSGWRAWAPARSCSPAWTATAPRSAMTCR